MSDPVTNVEIEDVLSSIRRLVSTDGRDDKARDASADEPAKSAPEAKGDDSDRLVLSPSLRVDNSQTEPESESDSDPEDTGAPQNDTAQDDVAEPADMSLGAHDDDATENVRDNEALTSGTDDGTVDAPQAHSTDDRWMQEADMADDGIGGAVAGADADETPEPGFDGDPAPDFMQTDMPIADHTDQIAADVTQADDRADNLHARAAVMEEAVASRDEEWEPDGTTDDAYSGGPVDPLPWEDFQPDAAGTFADPVAGTAAGATGAPDDPAPDFSPADTGEIWDVEDAPHSGAFIDADDEGDGDAMPSAGPADAAELEDAFEEATVLPEDILDEEALRDLVSEIVREELQGALGERITRNVRKLVRREIHRALAIQDLE